MAEVTTLASKWNSQLIWGRAWTKPRYSFTPMSYVPTRVRIGMQVWSCLAVLETELSCKAGLKASLSTAAMHESEQVRLHCKELVPEYVVLSLQ